MHARKPVAVLNDECNNLSRELLSLVVLSQSHGPQVYRISILTRYLRYRPEHVSLRETLSSVASIRKYGVHDDSGVGMVLGV